MRYNYCPKCGGGLSIEQTGSPNRPQCTDCSFVFYQNPIVGVAGIVIENQKILLGRRSGSYQGTWCIPCGYVEWDEDVEEALQREFFEETGLRIKDLKVYAALSNFHNTAQHTVGIWFLAQRVEGVPTAGDDLDQIGFFHYDDLPVLAFPTDQVVIDRLKKDGLIV